MWPKKLSQQQFLLTKWCFEVNIYLGYFCKKICRQDRSEIAQSGHTGSHLYLTHSIAHISLTSPSQTHEILWFDAAADIDKAKEEEQTTTYQTTFWTTSKPRNFFDTFPSTKRPTKIFWCRHWVRCLVPENRDPETGVPVPGEVRRLPTRPYSWWTRTRTTSGGRTWLRWMTSSSIRVIRPLKVRTFHFNIFGYLKFSIHFYHSKTKR